MDASLRQLAAYVAVAKAASFTAAAAQLQVSQSTLSRAVSDLERVLGARLLERDTRNVQLTAAGQETLRVAEEIVDSHRSGMKQLRRFLLGESGVVAMATLPSVAAVLLPRLISAFRRQRPAVSVRIMDGLERAVLGRVLNGDADFAVTTVGAASDRLDQRPLIRDRFRAVLPAGHPLARRDEVAWEDLAGEPFLAVGPESSVRRLTDAAFEQAGAEVRPAAEASNVATVGGLVAAGLGVSAMPALVLPLLGPGHVVHRELVGPVVERRLDVVVRARQALPPAAAAFLDLLDEARTEGREVPAGAAWIAD
ncbi:LysR family transcriptional regulator [Nonomuraea aridisoli]|uniref:LysR family transcriptional regulator n=1 Tax=Nonomuraea aridisoli TaxID=2070368 RepID=A0A2W2D9H1_9ACTN|nr:LysR family transcriptional regulator [Nonomuraea aridisoli]PZG08652.1 LysR family transcriptional regulator [Nonomuraea aridisoli]